MAAFLYRLGSLAFRRRLLFVVMWVVVLAGVAVAAVRAPAAPPDVYSVPGTESQQANSLLQGSFPGSNPDGAFAQLVFVAPHGQQVSSTGYRTVIDRVVAVTAAGPQVATAVNPFQAHLVSRDGSTAIATITYKVAYSSLTAVTRSALQDAVREGDKAGLSVHIGGTALTPSITSGPSVAAGRRC